MVTGPPCSGKSTYVREHARPGHIVIDFDLIAQALGSPTPHDHPDPVRRAAMAARRAAIAEAIAVHHRTTVWIVQTRIPARDLDRYTQAGAHIVTLDADAAELHRRASAERPDLWHQLIDEWAPPGVDPSPRGAPARGSGSKGWAGGSTRAHRRARADVLARDGWRCQIQLPGCTTLASQAHHTLGKTVTGDDPAHMVAACHHCNNKVGDPRRTDPVPSSRTRW